MQRGFWIALALVVVGFIGLFFLAGGKDKGNANPYLYNDPLAVQAQDHKVGTGKAVLIEYGDLQCPACRAAFPIIQNLKATMTDKMTFVYRDFPLSSIHPHAMAAHRAAEAAAKQGKFFEMHDLMYLYQDQWSQLSNPASVFESYAQQLALDLNKFREDVASADTFNRISADQASGGTLGINSTPTFYLNGQKVSPLPRDLKGWQDLITKASK